MPPLPFPSTAPVGPALPAAPPVSDPPAGSAALLAVSPVSDLPAGSAALLAVPSLPATPTVPPLPALPTLPGLSTDPLVALAYLLLVAGVAGSVLPLPSGALSLGGLYLHWWQVGRPGPLLLAALTVLAAVALAADLLGGPLAARASGVPTRRAALAGVVGLVGALLAGPVGLLAGLAGTVFALEYRDHGDSRVGARAAAVATAGVLAAAAVQIVATTAVLVGVLLG